MSPSPHLFPDVVGFYSMNFFADNTILPDYCLILRGPLRPRLPGMRAAGILRCRRQRRRAGVRRRFSKEQA